MNLYDDDPVLRRAEEIADEYARQHHHAPITEDRAAQMWDEAPAGYVGRRRANEDGTRMDRVLTVDSMWPDECPDPGVHSWLERNAAQEHRPRAQVPPGNCRWCGKAVV